MFVTGYEYKSALGATIRKIVICETQDEYKRVMERIRENEGKGVEPLKIDEVLLSTEIN